MTPSPALPRARHDASNLAACFGCFAEPGAFHDPGCKYGLQAEVVALRDENDRLRAALEGVGAFVEKYPSIPDLAAQVGKRISRALADPTEASACTCGGGLAQLGHSADCPTEAPDEAAMLAEGGRDPSWGTHHDP